MLEFVGNLVSGGWNALGNVVSGIGKGASSVVSSFFPASQKTTTVSEIAMPRENQGLSYRPVQTDFPSLFSFSNVVSGGGMSSTAITPTAAGQSTEPSFLSKLWNATPLAMGINAVSNWLNPTPAQQVSQAATLANQWVSEPTTTQKVSPFDQMLQDVYNFGEEFATGGEKVLTLADRLLALGQSVGILKPRETVVGTPTAGAAEGTDVQYLNNLQNMGANVLSGVAATVDAMWNQVKGLFNLGYSGPEGAQPVFTVSHEISPSTGTTTGLIIAAIILFVLYLVFRKK
jgi:hypothetical protein